MTGKPLPEESAENSAPASAEAPIICVRDVSFTYDGETLALSGASVRIARGEFVCIPRSEWGCGMGHKTISGGLMPGGRLRMEKLAALLQYGIWTRLRCSRTV